VSGRGGNPFPTGLNFGGPAAERLERALAAVARENARRVPCPAPGCALNVLPENLRHHLDTVHGEDDD